MLIGQNVKNRLINSKFDYWQRNTSFVLNAAAYTADRWYWGVASGGGTLATGTITRQSLFIGSSFGEQTYFMRINNTSTGSGLGATSCAYITQRHEDVRSFAGKKVKLSVWMSATTAKQVAVYGFQYFGSGGSAGVNINTSANGFKTLTGSVARYDFVINVPSVSGKTIGTSSCVEFGIVFQAGSTFLGDFGYGSGLTWGATGNIDIVRTMVAEINDDAESFDYEMAGYDLGHELILCQRYYEKSWPHDIVPGVGSSQPGVTWLDLAEKTGTGTRVHVGQIRFVVKKRSAGGLARIWNHRGDFNENRMSVYNVDSNQVVTPNWSGTQNGFDGYAEAGVTLTNSTWGAHWTYDCEL